MIENLALLLELRLDAIITQPFEAYERFILQHCQFFAKVDLWIWTPKELLNFQKYLVHGENFYIRNIDSLDKLKDLYHLEKRVLKAVLLDKNRLQDW